MHLQRPQVSASDLDDAAVWEEGFRFLATRAYPCFFFRGRPRGTVVKASASEARGPGIEPPWLVQRSRWESRPLSLVGNGAGAVTLLIDRAGSVFPRGTGRFLVKKDVHIASFRCLSEERLSWFKGGRFAHSATWTP